jgi:uncharacterized protein YdeI (YjbR/CyaY-like superfamily)
LGKKDPRIDAYIANAQPFARPILKHLRKLVHQGCPGAQETIKWGSPHFDSDGDPLAGMASFKAHCVFGFWKSSLLEGLKADRTPEAMGQFGRIASLEDLPSDAQLLKLVRAAAKLNAEGIKVKKPKAPPKPPLPVPADLAKAFAKNKQAKATFDAFPPSARREYIEWLLEAKREETRAARLEKAVAMMAQGKRRYWEMREKA